MQKRSMLRVIRGVGAVALSGGALAGVVLALWIAHLNPGLSALEVGVVALHLSVLYAAVHALWLGAAAALLLLAGLRPEARVLVGLAIGFWVLVNGVLRHISAVQALSVTPHMAAVGVLDAVAVAVAAALATLAIAGGRRRAGFALGASALIFLLLEGMHAWHERPRFRDLARDVPAALAAASVLPPRPAAEGFENARLVVLGFDGLSWEVVLPLLQSGQLPAFRALLEGAAYGNLTTHPYTKSPPIWETVSTGKTFEQHGIGHHVHFEIPGLHRRISHLPYFPLGNSPMLLRRLLTYTADFIPWRVVGSDGSDARSARFWEIAQRAGLGVGLYDWLNTTPAAPVRPFLHGYGSVPPRTFPTDLEDGLPALPEPARNGRSGSGWVEEGLPYERAGYARFRLLAQQHHPDLLLYYTHFGDAVNHLNWRDEAHGSRFFISGLRHPELRPGPAIGRAMSFLDEIVGDVLSRLPPEATLVLVSDHGFDFRGYEHDNGPPGVVVVRGPGLRSGPIEHASIYDVTPTLLHLLDLPVGKDMVGRPLELALPGGPRDRPVAWVASHGPALPSLAAGTPDPEDVRAHQEYLRALGYVN